MTAEKKEKLRCNPHSFIITGWITKGGRQDATKVRCCHCLTALSLEQLESQEIKDKLGI